MIVSYNGNAVATRRIGALIIAFAEHVQSRCSKRAAGDA